MKNGQFDLACRSVPRIGTGILHIRGKRDRRVLDGNRKMAGDNFHRNCDNHLPVWRGSLRLRIRERDSFTPSFFTMDLSRRETRLVRSVIV